eukprot:scaffold181424_cov28-Tisochrysis_lutea.AAC.4
MLGRSRMSFFVASWPVPSHAGTTIVSSVHCTGYGAGGNAVSRCQPTTVRHHLRSRSQRKKGRLQRGMGEASRSRLITEGSWLLSHGTSNNRSMASVHGTASARSRPTRAHASRPYEVP